MRILQVLAIILLSTFGFAQPTKINLNRQSDKILTSPTITTPLGIIKSDVGLGNVDNVKQYPNTNPNAYETPAQLNIRDSINRIRTNHTNTQLANTISDFNTAVAANSAVTANTAKITNATHTGDVTGATALTIADNAVTNAKAAQMATKTYKGRTSVGTGNSEDVGVATLKNDLVLVKADVGLANVDNTSDANKPVSTAGQTALDLKSNLASPTFTGTVTIPTPFTLGATSVTSTGTQLNYINAATGTTGTNNIVYSTSPTLVTPALGTPTALLGTNITGTAAGLTAGNVTTNANLTGHITSSGNAAVLGSFSSANLSTALSDKTGTGVSVFGTSPTFTTGITSPLILGGTGTTQSLTYKTTTGVGATGARHIFQVGNNGATEAMTILNNGNVGIGTDAPTAKLGILGIATTGSTIVNAVAPAGDNASSRIGVSVVATTPTPNGNYKAFYADVSAHSNNWGLYIENGKAYINGSLDMVNNSIINVGNTAIGGIASASVGNLLVRDLVSTFAAGNGGNLVFSGDDRGQGFAASTFANIRGVKENGTYLNSLGALVFGTQSNSGAAQGLSTVTEKMRISSGGNVGIGTTSPTAVLHLKAGTTAASTAPIKLTSGSLMTTAEAGAIEFLSDAYHATITTGAARRTFAFLETPTFTGTVTAPTITSTSTIILKGYTVAGLPTGVIGMTAYVTNALAPTYAAIAVGGGAVVVPVFFNGTNWITN